ncbi:glycosyl hydrolase [Roseomonas sp. KE0001]|uniref:glycosyl hydrolase n=1 Tax=Roseomonas sp. KE0001 TaxID=2479201 RepID=UPI0018DF430C|nr:glycosyl hydrolase [Roseomonas sp. KE0001]MBI0435022.1 hypothetical protein [Roseomonas sp. KE0001]
MALLGVYVGNDRNQVSNFEKWLGHEVDGIHAVVGFANWNDFVSSAKWMVNDLWKPTGRDLFWSVPLITRDANLYSAANGDYNQYYRTVAQTLVNGTPGSDDIYVRTGWEFNGNWFYWNAIGKEQAFIGAFREFVEAFRSVSDRFKFEWNVNEASGGIDPAKAYPGDDYVDIIGMDFYWKPEYTGNDPVKAFETVRDLKYGLKWLENFADAHGKPTAYSEWGVKTDTAAPYIKLVQDWFESHDVVYQTYWDSNDAFPGKISDGTEPRTGAAYKAAFGGGGSGAPEVGGSTGGSSGNGSSGNGSSGNGSSGGNSGGSPVVTPPTTPSQPAVTTAEASDAPSKVVWGNHAGVSLWGSDANEQFSARSNATMYGGKGDDTFIVNTASDRVVEYAGQGTDTVKTWLHSYTLPDQVENLTFTGYGNSKGYGNGLANIIIGNDGSNVLDGRGGNDVLTGGRGADIFVIAKGAGHDTITDFARGTDKLQLSGFSGDARLSFSGGVATISDGNGWESHVTLKGVTGLSASDYFFG